MDLTYHDTKDFRAERGKEVVNEFRLKVLEKEHQAVSQLREQADYLITKDYSLIGSSPTQILKRSFLIK